jgi:Family of unknown function (DUF6049)
MIARRKRQPTIGNSIPGMACQRTRRCWRFAAVAAAAAAGWLAAAPAAVAGAGRSAPPAHPWIAITSLSPTVAVPKGRLTVSGIVANPTGAALQGLSVQLWSSSLPLASRQAMNSYLTAQTAPGLDTPVPGPRLTLPGRVPAHGTEPWRLTLDVAQAGMRSFGVYPLAAQLGNAVTTVDVARTFLPFWPGKSAARSVKPLTIGWVWPLIDTPQQGACPALLSNELSGSVKPGGRLGTLLAAGQSGYGRSAQLTWVIDPALLSDVKAMEQPYQVGARADCSHGRPEPASRAAAAWLSGVKAVTGQQDFFVTPYADVDMAAMAHHGLNTELSNAFNDGQAAARQILGRAQRATPAAPGLMAWPAGGIADYNVLEELAGQQHVHVLILDSKLMPPVKLTPAGIPVSYTPTAVTTTPNRLGGQMNVLLSDHGITQILAQRRNQIPGVVPGPGTMPASMRSQIRQAAAFGKEQWFLAETAMIAAETASGPRAVVAAPPRRWDPPRGLADALLQDTATAPWLRPATLAGILAEGPPPGSPARQFPPPHLGGHGELNGALLRQVRGLLTTQVGLLDSILTTKGHGYLSTAIDAVGSSAWRGGRRAQRAAAQLLRHELAFVEGKLQQVRIVGSSRVTLGGKAGDVPVSVRNGLPEEVTVRLKASAPAVDRMTIAPYKQLIKVPGGEQVTVRIPVRAVAAGSKTLTLWLTTPEGARLPVQPTSLTVTATHFGTLAVVIISVALVVFVLSAAARAIRRGGPQDGGTGVAAEDLEPMPSPRDPASGGDEPGSVGSGTAQQRQPAKENDEHATAPGGADRR